MSIFAASERWQRGKFCTYTMTVFKSGQIVKFQKPFPGEDPEQNYIVLEGKEGREDSRVDISPLNLGLEVPPVYTVRSAELVVI